MKRYRYEVGYVTDPGNRRGENQDSLIIKRGSIDKREFLLLAVADGMGGTARGGLASHLAAEQLSLWWDCQLPLLLEDTVNFRAISGSLNLALEAANSAIQASGEMDDARSGTTLSLLFLYSGQYLLLHVGDSRIYLLRKREVLPLSVDQTWCQREISLGHLSATEAAVHPMRHVLLNALGMTDTFRVQEAGGTIAHGDTLLLCSDGFYNELDVAAWLRRLRHGASVQHSLDSALRTIKAGTAEDNITAILAHISTGWGR